MKVLFILKRKESPYGDYGTDSQGDKSPDGMETGLLNSARFVQEMLQDHDIQADLVVVHDNNDIDREVTKHRPDVVIIEALWVVPEKFDVLQPLHPDVRWIVRLHSATPFIANEGIAMRWIFEYVKRSNVSVSTNDRRLLKQLSSLFSSKFDWNDETLDSKLLYQPNYYPADFQKQPFLRPHKRLHIGCFGAVRPLKNQLIQAVAAIEFADSLGKKLDFHINGNRVEMKGSPVLHNLIDLFKHASDRGHRLVMHDWMKHCDFKALISAMDLGLQVSYSETFNIVTADFVSSGVPVVTSDEVSWSSPRYWADPNCTRSIVSKLKLAYRSPRFNVWSNQRRLRRFDVKSVEAWIRSLRLAKL